MGLRWSDMKKLVGVAAMGAAVAGAGGAWRAAPEGEAAEPELAKTEAAEPGSFELLEDGSLVIEGVLKVPGKGTAEHPYVVDWAVLTSASRVYQPRVGKEDLPAWVGALAGKRVRLTGFLIVPLTAASADELLIMQNQWDGCCIGVPPTPYDAVEVRLAKAMDTSRGVAPFGAIDGTLKVDPYIVSGWLLGLYLLEDAEVVKEREGT